MCLLGKEKKKGKMRDKNKNKNENFRSATNYEIRQIM